MAKTKQEIIEMLEQLLLKEEQLHIERMDTLAITLDYVKSSTDRYAENDAMGEAHDREEKENG